MAVFSATLNALLVPHTVAKWATRWKDDLVKRLQRAGSSIVPGFNYRNRTRCKNGLVRTERGGGVVEGLVRCVRSKLVVFLHTHTNKHTHANVKSTESEACNRCKPEGQ
uniref:Putative secreted protein n=1 Tax=Anopheles darlingi TaxID=43151 RepID=A0A2M4D1Z0_ANODA